LFYDYFHSAMLKDGIHFSMKKIPIQFDYNGKRYEGHFSEVSGASANTWHLTIDNYYKGQLLHTNNGWAFYNNKDEMKDMAEYFGE
jgi:hypothetical protein